MPGMAVTWRDSGVLWSPSVGVESYGLLMTTCMLEAASPSDALTMRMAPLAGDGPMTYRVSQRGEVPDGRTWATRVEMLALRLL